MFERGKERVLLSCVPLYHEEWLQDFKEAEKLERMNVCKNLCNKMKTI